MKFTNYAGALMGFVSALALTTGAWAQAADAGPYLSIGGGFHRPESDKQVTIFAGPGFTTQQPGTTLSFHTGYAIVGAGGYKFTNGIRAELELDYRSAGVNRVNSVPWTGRQNGPRDDG